MSALIVSFIHLPMKHQTQFGQIIFIAVTTGLSLLGSGCITTYEEQQAQEMRYQQDMQNIQVNLRKLEGRLDGLDMQVESLNRAQDLLRNAPQKPQVSSAQIQALENDITELEKKIRAVDASREKDKTDIVNSLSGKIAALVSSGPKPTGSAKTPGKRAATQEGYEHVVEAGQTLSKIAAAYKVKPQAIMSANNLKPEAPLKVGQKLFIPAP